MPTLLACCRRAGGVPGDPTGQHGGLVVQVGVEVGVTETSLGRVERRVSQVNAAGIDQGRRVDAGDVLAEKPELSKAEVAGHFASRSRISWSRSSSFLARAVKLLSLIHISEPTRPY